MTRGVCVCACECVCVCVCVCACVSVCASLFLLQESWDYVGSSRMVYDMNNGVFPFARDKDKQVRPHPPPAGCTCTSVVNHIWSCVHDSVCSVPAQEERF